MAEISAHPEGSKLFTTAYFFKIEVQYHSDFRINLSSCATNDRGLGISKKISHIILNTVIYFFSFINKFFNF
ncbi:hypothetical protein DYH56_12175 [Psychrilyobacter piezotolerans]|uniref:N-acetyltransferase domain-containing protein n=1 Tax=Psychrilyobacter piezotolerans TaxID=2293438 RepID=A0ABX9KEH4_9FUSO|nr:hypothetical protein DV867_12175 [Psychrilyobacter sp. S5]REI40098.1 hypothetical protein DYH56_12175 [Psychrilyobacter piezotolerans]